MGAETGPDARAVGADNAGGQGNSRSVAPVTAFRTWLGSVDTGALSDRERVNLIAELERVKGASSAAQARAVHALHESREQIAPRDVGRSVASEVALARRESPTLGDRSSA